MERREFIKIGSIGFVALSSGIGTRFFLSNEERIVKRFSAFAFLPSDKSIITDFLKLFQNRITNKYFNNSLSNYQIEEILNKRFMVNNNLFSNSYVDVKLIKLEDKIKGDIFVSENSNLVLNPKKDFADELLNFRKTVNKINGEYLLSIEQKEENILADVFYSKNKFVLIENNKGIFDKISLSKNYSSFFVPGTIGKTEIGIFNGNVKVKSSPCRHKLCKLMSQTEGNKTIACVPNKVLINIV